MEWWPLIFNNATKIFPFVWKHQLSKIFNWQFMIVLTKSFLCSSQRHIKMQNNFHHLNRRNKYLKKAFFVAIETAAKSPKALTSNSPSEWPRFILLLTIIVVWAWRSSSLEPPTHRGARIVRWTSRHKNSAIRPFSQFTISDNNLSSLELNKNTSMQVQFHASAESHLVYGYELLQHRNGDVFDSPLWSLSNFDSHSIWRLHKWLYTGTGSAHWHSSLLNGHC